MASGIDWLRLWHDMPNDPKFRTVARISGQEISRVLAMYVHLLVDASQGVTQCHDESRTVTRGVTDVTDEDIASALDVAEDVIRSIRDAMQGRVLDGNKLTGWDRRQPKREDAGNPETGAKSAAERKREQRERERLARQGGEHHDESRGVTHGHDREEESREEQNTSTQALPKNKGGSDAASPAPRSPSKAARLPLDWVLPKQLGDWALQERPDWTAEHVRKVAEQFRDHWHAQGGANARKVDWAAAWRTWVRREPAGRVAGAGASAAPAAGWYETPEGVSAKGASLGIQQREGENRHVYRWRVLKAAADPVAIEKEVAAAARMNIAEHERAHQFFYGCLPGHMPRAA